MNKFINFFSLEMTKKNSETSVVVGVLSKKNSTKRDYKPM